MTGRTSNFESDADGGAPSVQGKGVTPEEPDLMAAQTASAERAASALVNAAQPDAIARIALRVLADSSIQDKRLLSTAGLLEVIHTLGIRFEAESLSFDSLADFGKVLAELPRGQALLADALTVVAHGNLALESGKTPAVMLSLMDDPITAYLGCLQFLEHWIDVHTRSSEDLGDPELHLMLALAHAANRKKADAKVASLLAGEVTTLQIIGEDQSLELVQPSDTVLALHNKEDEETDRLRTFKVREVPLAEAPELANMPMPSHPSHLFQFQSNLRDALFPESEYPDRTVVDRAQVKCTVGVVPLKGEEPILFKVGVSVGEVDQKLEIVIAGRNHTRGRDLFIKGARRSEDEQVFIGVPSQATRAMEELFRVQTESTLGPQRRRVLEKIGAEASKSIVIVLKPYISPERAHFRGKVLTFKQSPQGDEDIRRIADAIVYDKGADTIDWLNEHGWLGDKEPQVRRACHRLEAIKWSMASRPSYGGESMLMGGSDLIGYGLHADTSGVEGGRIGISRERHEVDPLTPPEILVIRVIGIQGGEEV